MLRRLTLIAIALSLLFAQAATAKPGPPGKPDPRKPTSGLVGFSDGR